MSRPVGATPLTDDFYTLNYPTSRQNFKFHVIHNTGYGVIAEKPRVGKLGEIFPCTV